MKIRERGYADYGLSKERVKEIMEYCRSEENTALVRQAAQEAILAITDQIFRSLTKGWSY